ncbi:MAG: type II toxin-antitoxin system VapC family toxin, partial [Anaerolineae bacterium]|nr:type II toxin-antitoxin system VapC family toxin [Anaerolineae bacterium]
MNVIVADASVMLKWQLRDEENTEQADRILRDLTQRKIRIIVPNLCLYEVVNGIRTAVTRGRLSRAQGRRAIEDFLLIGVNLYPFRPLAP